MWFELEAIAQSQGFDADKFYKFAMDNFKTFGVTLSEEGAVVVEDERSEELVEAFRASIRPAASTEQPGQ